jgi:hypothetical protein
MTVLPLKTRLELVLEELRQDYLFLCVELQAIKREIDQFNIEISKKDGLTYNTKIIPFPKTSVSAD